jgi:mannose-1-phosphate guanylyltransferase/phosphomannomutase
MVGLNASGVHLDDLEIAPVPVARFLLRTEHAQGGIHVQTAGNDPQSVEIRFFGPDGTDLDEAAQRKIERYFHREDFRRAFSDDMGEIHFPPRAVEHYAEALGRLVDAEAVKKAGLKIVVDYAHATTAVIMPKILGRLGADILALNAYPDPDRTVLNEARRTDSLVALSELVRNSRSHFGALLEPSGEGLFVVDDEGRVLTPTQLQLLCLRLMLPVDPEPVAAIPVPCSSVIERMIEDAGGRVVWTKVAQPDLMATARSEDAAVALGVAGGVALPRFLPAFDGMAVLARLVSLLPGQERPMSQIVDELPRPRVVHQRVRVPWEAKGAVMRAFAEEARDTNAVLIDGVKFEVGNGWAMVLPDPEEPVCHVWAEGPTDADSRRLADEQAKKVRTLVG